jgi:predicted CoA-binding protein
VAIRILHRVMENILKEKYSVIRIDPILSEIVDTLVDPIPEALELVRDVLHAPHETKILLTVDEIAKTTNEKTNLFSKDNL